MTFDTESFFAGVLIGIILMGILGRIAYAAIHKKENPYASKI